MVCRSYRSELILSTVGCYTLICGLRQPVKTTSFTLFIHPFDIFKSLEISLGRVRLLLLNPTFSITSSKINQIIPNFPSSDKNGLIRFRTQLNTCIHTISFGEMRRQYSSKKEPFDIFKSLEISLGRVRLLLLNPTFSITSPGT
jgi:hypothetical protein